MAAIELVDPAQPVEALEWLYDKAQRKLERMVRDALESGKLGQVDYLNARLAAVRAALVKLQRDSDTAAARAVVNAYLVAAQATDRVSDAVGTSFGGGLHEQALARLVGDVTLRLNNAIVQCGRRIDDAYRAAALETVGGGIARGATRREVTQDLLGELDRRGITGFTDRSGRTWRLDTYATMVARTTTREAMTQGTVQRLLELGTDLVTISSHRDPCAICQPLDGNSYSLSGNSGRYPVIPMLPPFHPNCKHVLTPGGASFEDFAGSMMEPEPVELKPVEEFELDEAAAAAIDAEVGDLPEGPWGAELIQAVSTEQFQAKLDSYSPQDLDQVMEAGRMVRLRAGMPDLPPEDANQKLQQLAGQADYVRYLRKRVRMERDDPDFTPAERQMNKNVLRKAEADLKKLREETGSYALDEHVALLKALREASPGWGEGEISLVHHRTNISPSFADRFRRVAAYLPRSWADKRFVMLDTPKQGAVAGSSSRSYALPEKVFMGTDEFDVMLHEFVHVIQFGTGWKLDPDAPFNKLARELHKRRTKGERLKQLRRIYPGRVTARWRSRARIATGTRTPGRSTTASRWS